MLDTLRALAIYIFCILFVPFTLNSQDSTTPPGDNNGYPDISYYTKEFNRQNSNLPSNNIYCLSKAKDGALWIGTDKGLVRYDKGKWQEFTSEESKPPGKILSVFLGSRDNSLWVATDKAVARNLEGEWVDFTKEKGNIPGGKINALMQGKDGRIWLGTQQGLSYFEDNTWHNVTNRDRRFSNTYISALVETGDGALWVGTGKGLECFYKGRWQTWKGKGRKLPNKAITALLKTSHFLWVGTSSGLGRINIYKEAWQSSIYEEIGLLNTRISTMCETDGGTIWIGTRTELWRYENKSFKLFRDRLGGKIKGRVTCLLDSSDGALWVGTNKGLFRIRKSRWQFFTPRNSQLPGARIRGLLTTQDGTIWAGTDKGLAYLEKGTWKVFSDDKFNNDHRDITGWGVSALAEMGNGNILVGLEKGLIIIQNGIIQEAWWEAELSMKDKKSKKEQLENINALLMTTHNSFWVGTDKGLYRFLTSTWEFLEHSINRISGVNALFKAKDSTIWIGTEDGLVRYHLGEWKEVQRFENINITAIVQTNDTTYWIGSKFDGYDDSLGGLYYSKDDGWKYFEDLSFENPEESDVTILMKANEDSLWVGTKIGLALIHNKNKEMQLFTTENSDLRDNTITALSPGAFGSIWVGTPNGVARFYPPTQSERPQVELNTSLYKEVLTQPTQTFTAFAFDPKYQTEKFEYQWKVISEDKKLIHEQISKDLFLIYTFQDKCSYMVKVTAIDCYGYRSKPETYSFKIAIPKPTLSEDSSKKDTVFDRFVKSIKTIVKLEYLISFLGLWLLIKLYPRFAASQIKKDNLENFPFLLKISVRSGKVRRYLFSNIKILEEPLEVPKQLCRDDNSISEESVLVYNVDVNLLQKAIFKKNKNAMAYGFSGEGERMLLLYLHNKMVSRFKKKNNAYLPVFIDFSTDSIDNVDIENIIVTKLGRWLPHKVIVHLLKNNVFMVFIAYSDEKHPEKAKKRLIDFLNNIEPFNNRVLIASRTKILNDRKDIIYYKPCEKEL
jgi:ligand-binding sensor domain-containing protein